MSIYTALAIYFIIWWLSLFLVLPFGVRTQHEDGQIISGTEPGAPTLHRVGYKLLWTTILAGALFAAGVVFYQLNGFGALYRLTP